LSPRTLDFYRGYLRRAGNVVGLDVGGEDIRCFLSGLSCSLGGQHSYYRSLRAFFNWLYSPSSGFGLKAWDNPIIAVDPPKVEKKLLPALAQDQISYLINQVANIRDKAIISLFADSGLRLSELANIRVCDVDWSRHLIKTICKGNKEGLAAFGLRTQELLQEWLSTYNPNGGPIWNLKARGIQAMLDRLQSRIGLKCSPHVFRRSFATVLSRRGVDVLHIMRLGRWESIAMVDRYTRNVQFEDSLKFYSPIVS